jgi:hypothetical protein
VEPSRETLEHLLACVDAVYRGLGETAPRLTNDTYVVRVHEMGRSFGEVALALRTHLGDVDAAPLAVIAAVLERAARGDETGAMTLYTMAHVVGPRLLVSLRDAREAPGDAAADPAVTQLLGFAAQVTLAQVLSIVDVTADQPHIDDPLWQEQARALVAMVEKAGNAESFGVSR